MDNSKSERDSRIIALFKGGMTLQEIANIYGCSKQYIGQITKSRGIHREDGGQTIRLTKKHCKAEGCLKQGPYIQGYCSKHAARFKRHGDPSITLIDRNHAEKCMVDGCDKPYHSKGLCYNHYMSFTGYERRGNPLTLDEYLMRKQSEAKDGKIKRTPRQART